MSKQLIDITKIVTAFGPVDVDSVPTEDWVSLKNADRITIVLMAGVLAGGAGSAVTLLQATTVAGGSSKALAFDTVYQKEGTLTTSSTLAKTDVTSDTFTMGTSASIYVIEINASQLDIANGFDCIRVDVAASAGSNAFIVSGLYVLGGFRYNSGIAVEAVTD
jgi:hypothetical protein